MHDRIVVIRSEVIAISDVLRKVVLHCWVNVYPDNADEGIAIFSALLMPQAYGVANLMNRVASRAAIAQCDILLSSSPADHRRAAAPWLKVHKIWKLCGVRWST